MSSDLLSLSNTVSLSRLAPLLYSITSMPLAHRCNAGCIAATSQPPEERKRERKPRDSEERERRHAVCRPRGAKGRGREKERGSENFVRELASSEVSALALCFMPRRLFGRAAPRLCNVSACGGHFVAHLSRVHAGCPISRLT